MASAPTTSPPPPTPMTRAREEERINSSRERGEIVPLLHCSKANALIAFALDRLFNLSFLQVVDDFVEVHDVGILVVQVE